MKKCFLLFLSFALVCSVCACAQPVPTTSTLKAKDYGKETVRFGITMYVDKDGVTTVPIAPDTCTFLTEDHHGGQYMTFIGVDNSAGTYNDNYFLRAQVVDDETEDHSRYYGNIDSGYEPVGVYRIWLETSLGLPVAAREEPVPILIERSDADDECRFISINFGQDEERPVFVKEHLLPDGTRSLFYHVSITGYEDGCALVK